VVAWSGKFGLAILGPVAIPEAFKYVGQHQESAMLAGKAVLGAVGTISGAVTLWLGRGTGTPGSDKSGNAPTNLALRLAPPAFVLFLVVVLWLLASWAGEWFVRAGQTSAALILGATGVRFGATWVAGGVTYILLLFGLATALSVDMNRFSLHAIYRVRLIRAYLAASRPAGERDPNRFTGFDDNDDLPMRDLWPRPGSRAGPGRRPLHVVNVAMILAGEGHLTSERNAESFTFSPLHCGARNHGYRPTWSAVSKGGLPMGYGGDRGVSLGTAIAISGAAGSPTVGYHSSPVVSLLLTLFTLRLGRWLGNPGHAGNEVYLRSGPRSSVQVVLDEALGHTDAHHPYVYLCDGGLFENLGLYEMVLRRCHTIVVIDARSDPACAFGDLGNAIRRIRVDFGIHIDFQELPIYPREPGGPARAGKYCTVGTIRYSSVDPGSTDGTFGSQTEAALRAYQQAYRLPQTGRLDEATLRSLLPEKREGVLR